MEPRRHGDTERSTASVRVRSSNASSIDVADLVERLRRHYVVEIVSEDHWSTKLEKRRRTIKRLQASGHEMTTADQLLREVNRDHSLYGDGVDVKVVDPDGKSLTGYVCEHSLQLYSPAVDSGPRRFVRLVEELKGLHVGRVEHGELREKVDHA